MTVAPLPTPLVKAHGQRTLMDYVRVVKSCTQLSD